MANSRRLVCLPKVVPSDCRFGVSIGGVHQVLSANRRWFLRVGNLMSCDGDQGLGLYVVLAYESSLYEQHPPSLAADGCCSYMNRVVAVVWQMLFATPQPVVLVGFQERRQRGSSHLLGGIWSAYAHSSLPTGVAIGPYRQRSSFSRQRGMLSLYRALASPFCVWWHRSALPGGRCHQLHSILSWVNVHWFGLDLTRVGLRGKLAGPDRAGVPYSSPPMEYAALSDDAGFGSPVHQDAAQHRRVPVVQSSVGLFCLAGKTGVGHGRLNQRRPLSTQEPQGPLVAGHR